MIKWLTNQLGIGKKGEVNENIYKIVDVREMVDKEGNPNQLILEKIDTGIKLIKKNNKVVICCDYGMSRSNVIAIGILVKYYKYGFAEAVKYVIKKTGKEAIQLGLLDSVRNTLEVSNKKSKNKKIILITGASGFIGNNLVNTLKKKYELITPTQSEVDLLKGPIELDLLVKKFGVNLIIHLANPKIYTTTQAMGEMIVMLKNVLDVCKTNKIPILYPSSWVVFSGYNKKLLRVSEDLIPKPKDTYGESKLLCETLLNYYRKVYGLKICLLRLSPVYGLGSDRPKFIWNFFEKAKKNLPIYTHKYKNGLPVLDLIYIDDVISALSAVIKKNFYGTLHIGRGIGTSTFEIAQKIKKICNSKSEVLLQKIEGFTPKIIMDIRKAKKILNWTPKIALDNGLKKILTAAENRSLKP